MVDDLLFSESTSSGYSITTRTLELLQAKYGDCRPEREPTSYAGFSLTRNRAERTIKLTMPQKIIEAAREHAPELLEGKKADLPTGKKLQQMADALALPIDRPLKLSKSQQRIQMLIGSLKFIERLHPRLSLVLHRLSCVMSFPPPEAYIVACAALTAVYAERDVGVTFGGLGLRANSLLEGHIAAHVDLDAPAPAALEAHADATWGERNVYGLILTYAGGAILHQTKKIALTLDSSMETEAVASGKASENVAFAREILRGFGTPCDGPTLIGTDNLANQKVGSGLGSPTRSRHFLRRYAVLKQRIAEGEVTLRHVPDDDMPADFLTKWIPRPKLERSIRYATNARGATTDSKSAA